MKFRYTALSSDNQKLTGVLESENQDGAQEELHKMGVSIISIKEITDVEYGKTNKKDIAEKKKTGVETYTFLAIDQSGKEINGTIDARDSYSAYKRLITEYGFKINELYLSNATDAEKTDSIKKITEYEAKIKEEGIDVNAKNLGEEDELLKASEEIDRKIIDEIDQFIINTKKVLLDHKDKFSPPFLKQIESTLGGLERIRTSNNIKHITEVCNEIYELISNPDQDKSMEDDHNNTSYNQIINSLQSTGIVKKQFNIHSKTIGLSNIKSIFNKALNKFNLTTESKLPYSSQEKKSGFSKFTNSIAKKFKSNEANITPQTPESQSIIVIFFSYIFTPNVILRKARKQELIKAFNNWRQLKKDKKLAITKASKEIQDKTIEESIKGTDDDSESETSLPKWKLSAVFSEMDSFIGWLLFFYIAYFFLINFSFEKDIGIPREFIAKTVKTPLILDITIFLLVTHLLFKIRDSYFKKNAIGSVFLFLFGLGFYSLIILNF